MEVRTRFAPSPSGYLHVGGARTALFNYLHAKAMNGKFILRVEDTDQERSTPESERIILDSLKWLGIHADEGVDEGGPYGPYRQSERLDIYTKYTEKLISDNKAYPCFCTNEELEAKSRQSKQLGIPHVYDGKCSNLTPEEREEKIKAGEKYAIRFRVENREVVVNDLVQGKVKFDSKLIGDFIIVKSDGFPSYNYAVIIDDYEMKISHVIRGVGHLSNTPRQILIHEALDLPLPSYAHISEIVGTDKKKLSKRRGATSVMLFKDMGYISEAFVNYMALLGWYPEDGVEFMPDHGLEHKFDVNRCSKAPAMFDFFLSDKAGEGEDFNPTDLSREELKQYINNKTKLNWINNKYIRHMDLDSVWELGKEFLSKDDQVRAMLETDTDRLKATFDTLRVYLDTLDDAIPYIKEIFRENITLETDDAKDWMGKEESQKVVEAFVNLLKEKQPSEPDAFSECMKLAGKEAGVKGKGLFMPIRAASTGTTQGLELPTLFTLLGHETVVDRIHSILNPNHA